MDLESSICRVCRTIKLIQIVKTGSTGANMSQIIAFQSISFPHKNDGAFKPLPNQASLSSSLRPKNTIPKGINAIIAQSRMTLIISTPARATRGIKTATLIADFNKNSVNQHI